MRFILKERTVSVELKNCVSNQVRVLGMTLSFDRGLVACFWLMCNVLLLYLLAHTSPDVHLALSQWLR